MVLRYREPRRGARRWPARLASLLVTVHIVVVNLVFEGALSGDEVAGSSLKFGVELLELRNDGRFQVGSYWVGPFTQ